MATTTDGLTTAEVASQLGVDPTTVRNMIRDGRLKGFRPTGATRGKILIPVSEVVRHQLETGQLPTPAAA